MENRGIGTRIALLRKEKGMTQKQLASIIGVNNKTLSQWETGAEGREPDIYFIGKLADALEVDCDYLIRGVQTEHVDIFGGIGLTDKAIEQLRFIKQVADAGGTDVISYILSHEKLILFLTAILELQTVVKYGMPDTPVYVSDNSLSGDMIHDILQKTDVFLERYAIDIMSEIVKDYIRREIRNDAQ